MSPPQARSTAYHGPQVLDVEKKKGAVFGVTAPLIEWLGVWRPCHGRLGSVSSACGCGTAYGSARKPAADTDKQRAHGFCLFSPGDSFGFVLTDGVVGQVHVNSFPDLC